MPWLEQLFSSTLKRWEEIHGRGDAEEGRGRGVFLTVLLLRLLVQAELILGEMSKLVELSAQACCARHQSPQLPFTNSIKVCPIMQKF